MSGRDEWVEKQLAREAKGRAKAATLTTEAEVQELVSKLAADALQHATMASRLAAAGHLSEFRSEALYAGASLTVADELCYAFQAGKPISLKTRLESARERASTKPDSFSKHQLKQHEKLLAKTEAAAAKKAAKKVAK